MFLNSIDVVTCTEGDSVIQTKPLGWLRKSVSQRIWSREKKRERSELAPTTVVLLHSSCTPWSLTFSPVSSRALSKPLPFLLSPLEVSLLRSSMVRITLPFLTSHHTTPVADYPCNTTDAKAKAEQLKSEASNAASVGPTSFTFFSFGSCRSLRLSPASDNSLTLSRG